MQPISLQSSINAGGNYRVQVQSTPKTNAAYQLAESLKNMGSLAGQFGRIQTKQGQIEAAQFSGYEAEEELKRLKEEEPETFLNFIKQRSYKNSLIDKHTRTVMIPKLSDTLLGLSDANKYKNIESYREAVTAAINDSWTEFSEAVGEDVANSVEGKGVWHNLSDTLRVKYEDAYFESQDAVALENTLESLNHRFTAQLSPVDLDGNPRELDMSFADAFTKQGLKELTENHGLSRGEAMGKLRVLLSNRLEIMQLKGRNEEAIALHEAMSSVKSKDGVYLYDDGGQTSVGIARTMKAVRAGLEDDEDFLSQDNQDQFEGMAITALTKLNNGNFYSELSGIEKQLLLKPLQFLDPSFTKEKLEQTMGATEGSSLGGGVLEYNSLLDELRVNGPDRAVQMLNATTTSLNRALSTAQTIKPPAQAVVLDSDREQFKEDYRLDKLADPDLALTDWLKAKNIQPWSELEEFSKKFEPVARLNQTESYREIEKNLETRVFSILDTLKNEESQYPFTKSNATAYSTQFSNIIQGTLKQEIADGDITLDDVPERTEELLKRATANIKNLLEVSEGSSDLLNEEQNIPDASIGQAELFEGKRRLNYFTPHGIKSVEKDVKDVFKTNATKVEISEQPTGKKSFFFIDQMEDVHRQWKPEDIQADRDLMVAGAEDDNNSKQSDYADALGYSLHLHGADLAENGSETIKMMKLSGQDAMDIRLFTETTSLDTYAEEAVETHKALLALEKLTPRQEVILEQLRFFGIINRRDNSARGFAERLSTFIDAQFNYLQNK